MWNGYPKLYALKSGYHVGYHPELYLADSLHENQVGSRPQFGSCPHHWVYSYIPHRLSKESKNQFWYITVILKNITTSKNRPENHECFVGCLMVSRKLSTLQRFLKQPRTSHSLILKKIWKTWTRKCLILKYLRTQLTHFLVSEINFVKSNSRVLGYKL